MRREESGGYHPLGGIQRRRVDRSVEGADGGKGCGHGGGADGERSISQCPSIGDTVEKARGGWPSTDSGCIVCT